MFRGVLDDSVRAGKLWTYLETHKLHESIWYGYALRNKRQHDISILMHPLPDQWNRQCKEFIPQTCPLMMLSQPRAVREGIVPIIVTLGFRVTLWVNSNSFAAAGPISGGTGPPPPPMISRRASARRKSF